MNESILIKVIAQMHCDFSTKFGIPRQSGLVKALKGTVVFAPEYRNPDAVRGLEGFSHIWLVWQFSEAVREGWSPMVRRRAWAGIPAWACSPHVPRSGLTRSVFPA